MLNVADFRPEALGLLKRHSPALVVAAFGATAARQVAAMPLREAVEKVAGGRAPLFENTATTDDLTKLLADTIGAAAIVSYSTSRPEIMRVSHETMDIEDFRPQERHRGDIFPALLETAEGAEVRFGTPEGRKEVYAAKRFSRRFEVSEQAIANDSLGLIVTSGAAVGEAVADVKASVLAGLLAGNPTMSDGETVFSAAHANTVVADAQVSAFADLLELAVVKMRRQKHHDGARPITVTPRFIVVPPELEMLARRAIGVVTPDSAANVNPLSALNLEVVVEPRLTEATHCFLMAAPANRLGLEHGTVNRTADPEIRTENIMERHAIVTRVTCDFAAGWLDYRGAVRIDTTA